MTCYGPSEVTAAVALALLPGATLATYATAAIRARLGIEAGDVRAARREQRETSEGEQ